MKIDKKASIGLSLFFFLIFCLSIFSTTFVNELANNTKGVLKDNYASVEYSVNMLKTLNEIHSLFTDQLVLGAKDTLNKAFVQDKFLRATKLFEDNLVSQEKNNTEKDEEILVKDLKRSYEKYIIFFKSIEHSSKPYSISDFAVLKPQYEKVRDYILDIYTINMNAIVIKNDEAIKKAEKIVNYVNTSGMIGLSLTGLFILIYLLYLINIKRGRQM